MYLLVKNFIGNLNQVCNPFIAGCYENEEVALDRAHELELACPSFDINGESNVSYEVRPIGLNQHVNNTTFMGAISAACVTELDESIEKINNQLQNAMANYFMDTRLNVEFDPEDTFIKFSLGDAPIEYIDESDEELLDIELLIKVALSFNSAKVNKNMMDMYKGYNSNVLSDLDDEMTDENDLEDNDEE